MTDLDPRLLDRLRQGHDLLAQRGELPTPEKLQAGYEAFRQRFGPERLRSLDGEALLHAMHTHGVIREPIGGNAQAKVTLRPVNLIVLEHLLSLRGAASNRNKQTMAKGLVFG